MSLWDEVGEHGVERHQEDRQQRRHIRLARVPTPTTQDNIPMTAVATPPADPGPLGRHRRAC
jgi:hypothetical protein